MTGRRDERSKGPASRVILRVAGCTGVSTTSRWVTIGHGDKRRVEVCWKHAEGEIDLESLSHDHGI